MAVGKVLITGATGFVGSHLAELLVRQGYQVTALTRPSKKTAVLEKLGIAIVRADIRDATATRKAVREIADCDCLFHIAAKTTKHRLSRQDYYAHNVEGTRNLAEAALQAGVKRMVYASSVGVYGTNCHASIDENTTPDPDSYYRTTKLGGEHAVLALHRQAGLPVVIARLGTVFGPRSDSLLDLCRKIMRRHFRIIGDSENHHPMVYVDDVVDGIHRCGKTKAIEGETYILSGAERFRVKELLAIIAEHLGVVAPSTHLPAAGFRLYQEFSRMIYRRFGLELPRAHYYDIFLMDHVFTTTKAHDELGYVPKVSVHQGIKLLIDWYRQEGNLAAK